VACARATQFAALALLSDRRKTVVVNLGRRRSVLAGGGAGSKVEARTFARGGSAAGAITVTKAAGGAITVATAAAAPTVATTATAATAATTPVNTSLVTHPSS
jgi:hypothetical protein